MTIHCIYIGTRQDVLLNWQHTLNNPIPHVLNEVASNSYLWGSTPRSGGFSHVQIGDIVIFAKIGTLRYLDGTPPPRGGIGRVKKELPVELKFQETYVCVVVTDAYNDTTLFWPSELNQNPPPQSSAYPSRFRFIQITDEPLINHTFTKSEQDPQQFESILTEHLRLSANSSKIISSIDDLTNLNLFGHFGLDPNNIPPELQPVIDDNPPDVPPVEENAPAEELTFEDDDISYEPPSEDDDNPTQDDNVEEVEPTIQPPNIGTKTRNKDSFNVSEDDAPQDCLHKLMLSKSLILEGVPGTGKTYAFNNDLVEKWESNWSNNDPKRSCKKDADAITMHPSTSYEDFIEGLRPTEVSKPSTDLNIPIKDANTHDDTIAKTKWFFNAPSTVKGNFSVTDGFFLSVCREALQHPDQDFLVLLDEINRCNIPSVFGDLLTAIERSKRAVWINPTDEKPTNGHWDLSDAQTITLAISKRQFFVPENVYVVGTMNTTDRSVAPMDMALRRRFAFHRIEPEKLEAKDLKVNNAENNHLTASNKCLASLNTILEKSHGHDAMLGFSYLYDMREDLKNYQVNLHTEICLHHWNHHILPQLSDIILSNQITGDDLKKILKEITIPNASFQVNGTKFDKDKDNAIESTRTMDRLQLELLELVPSNG